MAPPPRPPEPADRLHGPGALRRRRAVLAAAVAAAAAVFLVFWTCVPLNMDEFVSYQTLACLTHPHAGENVFCSNCDTFYLRVLGAFRLPLLTYDYIGSLSSFLYAPLYFLWPSPMSARLTGFIALLVQAFLLARLFRFRTAAVFCCLLLFLPYSFAHIADTGPVAFQTTSVLAVCYLLHRWLRSGRRAERALLMAAAGLLVAMGCWVKPTYFFVSAGLAVTALAAFLLAMVHGHRDRLFRVAEFALLVACAAGPTLLVYEAARPGGGAYLPVLSAPFIPSQVYLTGLGGRFRENVFHFLVNPLDATSFYFDARPPLAVWGAAAFLLGVVVVLSGPCRRGVPRRHRAEMLRNGALFVLALVLVATNLSAKSMHHAVLAYPFALLAAGRSIQGQRRRLVGRAVLPVFVALNGLLFLTFPAMLATARRNASGPAFVAPLYQDLSRQDAADSVIVCVDWGIYFVQSLYGPRSQVVLFLCAPDEGRLAQAAAIAERLHRKLTVVGLRGNQRVQDWLRAGAPGFVERKGPGDGSPWRIWQVPNEQLAALAAAGPPPRPTGSQRD